MIHSAGSLQCMAAPPSPNSERLFFADCIEHWLQILRNDKRAIFQAAALAQRTTCLDCNRIGQRKSNGGTPRERRSELLTWRDLPGDFGPRPNHKTTEPMP
jgi:antirestriction protein ArdC